MSICSIKNLTILPKEMQNLINSNTGTQSNKITSNESNNLNSLTNSSANKITKLLNNFENCNNTDFNINANLLNSNLQEAIKPMSLCLNTSNTLSTGVNDKPIIAIVSNNNLTPEKTINSPTKDHNYGTINLKPILTTLNSPSSNEKLSLANNTNDYNNNTIEAKNNRLLISSPSNLSVISLKSSQSQTNQITNSTSASSNISTPLVTTANKPVLKQQVMIGGKLLTSINRSGMQDPVQYIVKKSNNNQTIVIVSKPSSVISSPNTSTPISLINNPYVNASNINNSKINSDLVTNLKPIQLNESNLSINNVQTSHIPVKNNKNIITQVSNNNNASNIFQPQINSNISQINNQVLINRSGLFNNNNNNLLLKPITLIPINKVNDFDKQSCNSLVYKIDSSTTNDNREVINYEKNNSNSEENYLLNSAYRNNTEEVIEISTATVEIDSTIDDGFIESTDSIQNSSLISNIENSIEAENKYKLIKKNRKRNINSDDDNLNKLNRNNLKKKNPNKDITRCICGMDHDDGFMICCDKCLVWQHIVCMDINKKKIPDKFFCELCQPREVNAEKAKEIQKIYFNNMKKSKNNNDNSSSSKSNNNHEKKILKINSNSNNIDLNDNSCINEIDVAKLENSELDGQNDLLDDENRKTNSSKIPIKSQNEPNISFSISENDKSNKSSKKTDNCDIIDDKENGVDTVVSKLSIDSGENNSSIKKKKKVKKIREELENNCLKLNNKTNQNKSNKEDLKREKQNEYSNEFLKLQHKLNEPDTSSIASSSSSSISNYCSENQFLNNNFRKGENYIKKLVQSDFLKLVKIIKSKSDNNCKKIFRVKSNQNIKKNQIIGEYLGRVMLENEYNQNSSNPFVIFYQFEANDSFLLSNSSNATTLSSVSINSNLDTNEKKKICIDSSSIGNLTRYIRKSCNPNCKLKHITDEDGHIHFLVFSIANISKGVEISLPYDIDKTITNDNKFIFCNCDNKNCSLRAKLSKLNQQTEVNKVKKGGLKRMREISLDSNNEQNKQEDKTKNSEKFKDKNIKIIETKENEHNSKKKLINTSNNSNLCQSVPNQKFNATTNKVLSREDRKLISYMKVIERLEMQGKRKKMLKEQKDILTALNNEPKTESKSPSLEIEADNQTKNHTKNGLNKNEIRDKSNKSIGLMQSRHNDLEHNQLDNEIANIIENGIEKQDPNNTNVLNTNLLINNSLQSSEKIIVKSPDFSFVNLSIQPRKTLNLLQRNLSSPSLLCEHKSQDKILLESSKSLTDNYISDEVQTQSGSFFEDQYNEQSNQNIFNPKKYWLKCSSNVLSNSENIEQTNLIQDKNQPLKKRRHLFEDNQIADVDVSSNQVNKIESYNDDILKSFQLDEKLNENPTQIDYKNQIFIPNLISNAFENYINQISPYQLTPNYHEINPFFQYGFNFQIKSEITTSDGNFNSNPLASPSKEIDNFKIESLESNQNELDPSYAAILEAQKRKKVSLAEYRQRKETKPNTFDEHSNSNKQNDSILIKDGGESSDNQEISNELHNGEQIYNDKRTKIQNESKSDNISNQDCKSKLSKFISDIIVNKKPTHKEIFEKKLNSNFFEEREKNLKKYSNLNIKGTLAQKIVNNDMTNEDLKIQNLSLLIPISDDFPNKQSTPVPKSKVEVNSIENFLQESKFNDSNQNLPLDEVKTEKSGYEDKLDSSLIKIVDSSNKLLDGNDFISSDTDYEISKTSEKNSINDKISNSKNSFKSDQRTTHNNFNSKTPRSNSKSSTRSSRSDSNLSSISSYSDSNINKSSSSEKSNNKLHFHQSRYNTSKNRNLSRESNSSFSSIHSSKSDRFNISSDVKDKNFRNESKTSRSTISSKNSKYISSDEDSSKERSEKKRKRFFHVDDKNNINFGLIRNSLNKTNENLNASFDTNSKRKNYYADEQDRSFSLTRRPRKEYSMYDYSTNNSNNRYEFSCKKYSDYHPRNNYLYNSYTNKNRNDKHYNVSNESNSNSLNTYASTDSKNRLKTRSSSRESIISDSYSKYDQQSFNKNMNDKISRFEKKLKTPSPKTRRKQSLSPSNFSKSNHEKNIRKSNEFENDWEKTQKEKTSNYERSKYDSKYESFKTDLPINFSNHHDNRNRKKGDFENEKSVDKDSSVDKYDYKNITSRNSYNSKNYECYSDDDINEESISFNKDYNKYYHNSNYSRNKFRYSKKQLPKFDLRYQLNKRKNFSSQSFQTEDLKNEFDSSKSSSDFKSSNYEGSYRKRNLSNSRVNSSNKKQKE